MEYIRQNCSSPIFWSSLISQSMWIAEAFFCMYCPRVHVLTSDVVICFWHIGKFGHRIVDTTLKCFYSIQPRRQISSASPSTAFEVEFYCQCICFDTTISNRKVFHHVIFLQTRNWICAEVIMVFSVPLCSPFLACFLQESTQFATTLPLYMVLYWVDWEKQGASQTNFLGPCILCPASLHLGCPHNKLPASKGMRRDQKRTSKATELLLRELLGMKTFM